MVTESLRNCLIQSMTRTSLTKQVYHIRLLLIRFIWKGNRTKDDNKRIKWRSVLIVAVLFAIVLSFACAVRMPDLSLLQSRDGNDVWTDESGLPYFPDPDSARMHMTNRFLSDVCFGTVIIYLIFAVVSSVFLQRSGRFACYLKYLYIIILPKLIWAKLTSVKLITIYRGVICRIYLEAEKQN